MKSDLKSTKTARTMIALGILLVAVTQVWATDWPPSEGTVKKWEANLCFPQEGQGGGSCTGISPTCAAIDSTVDCAQHSYMYRADKRNYGKCQGPNSGVCYSYTRFYCAKIEFSQFPDCDPPADDCFTWIRIEPDICNPAIHGGLEGGGGHGKRIKMP